MPNVSLNAFLKIVSKNSPQKTQEYGRYLTPGGYDFYWRLKEAAVAYAVDGKSFEDCMIPLADIAREVEKKHNVSAFKSLDKWMNAEVTDGFFSSPIAACPSPEGFITVKLEPAFGCVRKGKRLLVHLWAAQGISLPRNVAACGLYLMKQHLCVGEYSDCTPAILDLRRPGLIVADALPPQIALMVASEYAWADGFFKASSKAA